MTPQMSLVTGRFRVLGAFRPFVLGLCCFTHGRGGSGGVPADDPSSAAPQVAPQRSAAGVDPMYVGDQCSSENRRTRYRGST
jgi:hypothetical protein